MLALGMLILICSDAGYGFTGSSNLGLASTNSETTLFEANQGGSSGNSVTKSEVIVEASGATLSDARDEAIRTALLSTVEQLIITDRLVKNGEIVQDDILATQNGFVAGFEVLEQYESDLGEVVIRAKVRIAQDTIVNFVALRHGDSSSIDGASMFAELRRSSENRRVLGDMLDRFLKGYPWDVVSLDLLEANSTPGRDDRLMVSIRTKTDPAHISALKEFLNVVAVLGYEGSGVRVQTGFHPPQIERVIFSAENPYWTFNRYRSNFSVPTEHSAVQYCVASQRSEVGDLSSLEPSKLDPQGLLRPMCYLMPEGPMLPASWRGMYEIDSGGQNYKPSPGFIHGLATGTNVMFLIAFLDDLGKSTVNSVQPDLGGCLLVPVPLYLLTEKFAGTQPHGFATTEKKFSFSPEFGIPFRVGTIDEHSREASTVFLADVDAFFNVVLPADSIDLAQTRSFRGKAVFLEDTYPETLLVQFIGEPPLKPEDLCTELLSD